MPRVTVHVDADSRAVTGVHLDGARADDVEVVTSPGGAAGAAASRRASAVILEFCPRAAGGHDADLDRALDACVRPRLLAAVPWKHAAVPPGCAHADSAAYVLPANAMPDSHSFFPINWRYASGFALVEIEPVLDDKSSAVLSAEFFMTRQFQVRGASAPLGPPPRRGLAARARSAGTQRAHAASGVQGGV
jgi:hypothetical protein